MLRFNAKGEVIVPFFRAGCEEIDLAQLLEALAQAQS